MEKLSKVFQTRTMLVIRTICGGLILMASVALFGCGKEPVSSNSMQEYHASHPGARQIVSTEFGLVNMSIDMPEAEVEYQSAEFKNSISFENALRSALKSFMEDGTDLESPLGLIQNDYFGQSIEEQKKILFEYLNQPGTYLTLVLSDVGIGSAERNESIKENWIFYLYIESYSDHMHWAIVDRSGKKPTYNYGFN